MSSDFRREQAPPILSIAVPNRNQVNGLEIQEGSLREIAKTFGIQILVSDNHSDDDSQQYLRQSWSDFAQINLLSTNLGIVGNLRNLAEQATGDWIWFLGAGDLPLSSALESLMALLKDASHDVHAFIDNGDYECIALYLGGIVFRRSHLLEVIHVETDEIWPHVSWSIELGLKYPDSAVHKTQLIHVEPWTSEDDWHATKSMFPYAEVLNRLLLHGLARSPGHDGLSRDFRQSQKTLLRWYIQDRMSGKVGGLNRNLLAALRLSGNATYLSELKLLSIAISIVPLKLLGILKRLRRN